jgi:RNA polymerase sigma factor (sigma-70 family)
LKWTIVCQLLLKYGSDLRMYILPEVGGRPSDADDIEQEVRLRLYRAKVPREPRALLRAIARRLIIDGYRSRRVRNHAPLPEDDDSTSAELADLALERHREEEAARDNGMALAAALEEVAQDNPLGCDVFRAFHAGYTVREIGYWTGMKEKKVYRLIGRTSALIRNFLDPSNGRSDK